MRASVFFAVDWRVRALGYRMEKEELLEFEGKVLEVLPEGRFRVEPDNGHQILAYTGGRMKRAHIRVLTGDRVRIEMTPYDLTKGRITFREKVEPTAPPAPRKPHFARR